MNRGCMISSFIDVYICCSFRYTCDFDTLHFFTCRIFWIEEISFKAHIYDTCITTCYRISSFFIIPFCLTFKSYWGAAVKFLGWSRDNRNIHNMRYTITITRFCIYCCRSRRESFSSDSFTSIFDFKSRAITRCITHSSMSCIKTTCFTWVDSTVYFSRIWYWDNGYVSGSFTNF